MSSSLSRNSKVRKSFRLEITLEKSYVETSRPLSSPGDTLKSDLPTSPEREFLNTKNWSSDPKLVKDAPISLVTKKSSSSGNIVKSLLSSRGKKKKKQSDKTMNHTDGASSSQKTKSGPVTRIKTVIRSTKETIVEKLPGGSFKKSSGWLHRSRPKSVGASQRYGIHSSGNIHQRDPSLSPPRERKIAAKVDRSRSFNTKTRANGDGFVSKRCEVWERKSRESSPERSIILPLDLPSSELDRKSLIKQRTAMLFEPKVLESSLPSKKQLLLDLNGRTPKGTPCQSKPAKPQLKPKRVNLFKRGLPVKPTEVHQKEPVIIEPVVHSQFSPTDENVLNRNLSNMGKTCSVHQEGSVIEDDYGIDVLKTGYDQYANCNGVTSSSENHSSKDRSPDVRSAKYEKENQNVVLPISSKHRTTSSNSSKMTQEAVQSNGCVPNGVLTERLDKNMSNYGLPSKYGEVTKRQTVATLNGIKLVDSAILGIEDVTEKGQTVLTDNAKIDDDVFEVVDKRESVVTLNGVQLVKKEAEKDGYYFIDIVNRIQVELEELSQKAVGDMESDLSEEASGRLRAVIGKTNLLTTKKFKQFRGLCDENNHPEEGSKVVPPTSEDLAGFWDMVMLQVEDVKTMFEEIDTMRKNGWQTPKRQTPVKSPEVRTPSGKIRTKTRPKANSPNTKNSAKDTERAAKAKQQREEARRRLLAAKKAMRRRTLSGSVSDDGGVEIYC